MIPRKKGKGIKGKKKKIKGRTGGGRRRKLCSKSFI
jgi:hypothetical protein